MPRPVLHGLFALLLSGLPPAANAAGGATLDVSDAWIRQPPPGARVTAGYMTIRNRGAAPVTLTAVSSSAFGDIEVHRSVLENGMARMRPVGQLTIAAGGQATLEPGGYHLMLFTPAGPLRLNDTVELLLHTSEDTCTSVTATVRRNPPATTP